MSVLGLEAARLYAVEEMPDYEGKLEFVDGRLELSPPTQWRHAKVATIVTTLLDGQLGDEYFPDTELGSWQPGETVVLEHPWLLSFDLDALGG